VELGQLLFVGGALAVVAALRGLIARMPAWTHALPAYAIGTTAALWCIERIAPLVG